MEIRDTTWDRCVQFFVFASSVAITATGAGGGGVVIVAAAAEVAVVVVAGVVAAAAAAATELGIMVMIVEGTSFVPNKYQALNPVLVAFARDLHKLPRREAVKIVPRGPNTP